MEQVLLKVAALILIILLGYFLKRCGVFKATDYKIISVIVLKITLPAAIICNFSFSSFKADSVLLTAASFIMNLILLFTGYFVSKKMPDGKKALYMLNSQGFNIGIFTLSIVQSFIGASGVMSACMFDMGNALLCTCGSYVIAAYMLKTFRKEEGTARFIARNLFSSVTFDTFIILTVLLIFKISIPKPILDIAGIISSANTFLAMLMIGMMIEIKLKKEYLIDTLKIFGIRFLICIATAAVLCLPPFISAETKRIAILCLAAPMSSLAPYFTDECGGDSALAGFMNSISIIISLVITIALLLTT